MHKRSREEQGLGGRGTSWSRPLPLATRPLMVAATQGRGGQLSWQVPQVRREGRRSQGGSWALTGASHRCGHTCHVLESHTSCLMDARQAPCVSWGGP